MYDAVTVSVCMYIIEMLTGMQRGTDVKDKLTWSFKSKGWIKWQIFKAKLIREGSEGHICGQMNVCLVFLYMAQRILDRFEKENEFSDAYTSDNQLHLHHMLFVLYMQKYCFCGYIL